jgi:hypothetical protein
LLRSYEDKKMGSLGGVLLSIKDSKMYKNNITCLDIIGSYRRKVDED